MTVPNFELVPTPPVAAPAPAGFYDEAQQMSVPAAPAFTPGPVNHDAATAAFGHHADDARPHNEVLDGHIKLAGSPTTAHNKPESGPPPTLGDHVKRAIEKAAYGAKKVFGDETPAPPRPDAGGVRG